jgi:hypothetical protein
VPAPGTTDPAGEKAVRVVVICGMVAKDVKGVRVPPAFGW